MYWDQWLKKTKQKNISFEIEWTYFSLISEIICKELLDMTVQIKGYFIYFEVLCGIIHKI